MSVIIDQYKTNNTFNNNINIKLLLNNNFYELYLITDSSYYYCINDCGSGSLNCYCKDKDWAQGRWDGELLKYSKDEIFSKNLFNFLKDNSTKIINLNRKKLVKWLEENEYIFMKQYYSKQLNEIYEYFDNSYKKGFLKLDFYESILKEFEYKNKEILETVIRKEYDDSTKKEKIYINDLFFLEIDCIYTKNKDYSLQELSYKKINEVFRKYEILLNIDKDLFDRDINMYDIEYNILKKYIYLLITYEGFGVFSTGDNNIVYYLDDINDIRDIWRDMIYSINL
jgi:hypothetical protein